MGGRTMVAWQDGYAIHTDGEHWTLSRHGEHVTRVRTRRVHRFLGQGPHSPDEIRAALLALNAA